jgi:hypothetical protein
MPPISIPRSLDGSTAIPRFHMHYTPTSSSWMNLVERFFRDLTEFITEKSFASTRDLADAIIAFLAARNENPRRYDKRFEEKFWDVIGLYLNPPDKALVLCCDEKSQCQALERTQPGLPFGIGHIRTKTHDYVSLRNPAGSENPAVSPWLCQLI